MSRTTADPDSARHEVQAILASGVFTASSRQARLLEYLFDKVLQGKTDDLKEYTIAVELFQKPKTFDQHSDATVRVEAHRLRKKLQKYYETAGQDHNLRVVLPPGQYVLEFVHVIPGPEPTGAVFSAGRRINGNLVFALGESRWLVRARRKLVLAGGAVILVAVACIWLYSGRQVRPAVARPAAAAPQAARDPIPDPEPDAIRILAGHTGEPYIDRSGRRWQADRYFEGGTVREVKHPVARTGRPQLFRRVREGTCRYRIPLPPRDYELRLYLTDPDGPEAERPPQRRFRIMTVAANGRQLMAPYELEAEAGQSGDIRAFAPVRPGSRGVLDLFFWSARGPAAVSAIEILPMTGGRTRPVRITAQPQPYEDNQGRVWLPDDYYSGGKLGGYEAMITGGSDPGIYSGERIGDFEYYIPVPAGKYQVTLYFAEGWWGLPEFGGAAGTRIFDVLLNYETVLKAFDMLREAPPRQLVARTFRQVGPDRYGKIHLTFASRTDYASLRAIEVLPEK